MADVTVQFEASSLTMPLRSYWAKLPEQERMSYDAMETLARERKLAGTYKQGRVWFINLLAHMQLGMDETQRTENETPERNRVDSIKRQPALRKAESGRSGDADGMLRLRR